MDVADWLRALGLERYEAAFRENDVSAEVLCHLTADDLEGLGVATIGHRPTVGGNRPPYAPKAPRPVIGYHPTHRSARPAASSRLRPLPNAALSA
jgi:SAM domain (Sterile alpha motif)